MAFYSVDFPSLVNLEVIHGAYGRMKNGHHHLTLLHFLLQSQKTSAPFLNISTSVLSSCHVTPRRASSPQLATRERSFVSETAGVQ